MKILTAHAVSCGTVLAGVALLGGLLGSAHSAAQSALLGKAPTLSSTPYHVVLETPQTIFQGQDAAVVVRVQNRQGLPVDGIAVAFQIDPPRARYASIRPARDRTHGGRVCAILRSDLIGHVRLTVQVGVLTKRATITVVMPIAAGDGQTVERGAQWEATTELFEINCWGNVPKWSRRRAPDDCISTV